MLGTLPRHYTTRYKNNYIMDDYTSNESLAEDIGVHAFIFSRLGDFDSEPFSSRDDVTLLSYGWKYMSDSGDLMHWYGPGGVHWSVDLTHARPKFYRNNKSIGSLAYDDVVNMFSPTR